MFPKILENAVTPPKTEPLAHYVNPVVFNDLLSSYTGHEDIVTETFLNITLENLKFENHYLFSLENLLSTKITELFESYEIIKKKLYNLDREIKICRDTKDNLKKDLLSASSNSQMNVRFEPTLRKYTEKFFQFKKQYKETLLLEKEMFDKLITLWIDIESIRAKLKRIKTPVILVLNEKNENELKEKWMEVFNQEYSDYLDKIEFDYVGKYLQYKTAKSTGDGVEIRKPKLEIDEDLIKAEVEGFVNDAIEGKRFDCTLVIDNGIVGKGMKSVDKKPEVGTELVYIFEIYIDDIYVCESEQYHTKSFSVDFKESFTIQILKHNQALKIILLENDERFSVFKLNLNEIKAYATESTRIKFKYDGDIKPNSRYIGSGNSIKEITKVHDVRLKSGHLFDREVVSTCTVGLRITSKDPNVDNEADVIKSSMATGRQIQRLLHGIDEPNLSLLLDLINKVYEQDIGQDEAMIMTLKQLCKERVPLNNNFGVDLDAAEYTRLKLLRLRNGRGAGSLRDMAVPLHASQITTEQLEYLNNSDTNDLGVEYFRSKRPDMDPIELKRYTGVKYIERLNSDMLRELNERLLKKTYRDVVRDYSYGGWR